MEKEENGMEKKEVKMKKEKKKVVKEVGYERVIGKKGSFKVLDKDGGVILWSVRNNGDYLVYVVNEKEKELGMRLVRKMMMNEKKKKEEKEEVQEEVKEEVVKEEESE